MKYISTIGVLTAVLLPIPASALGVYAGCSVPSLKSGHHTFYINPESGSLSGNGSSARPWRTLTEVLDPANKLISTQAHAGTAYTKGADTALHALNPNGPIKAGDLILLESGDYGSVTLTNMFNTDFITIAAAPGATPIISKLAVVSSAKWMFQGLTFKGAASTQIGASSVSMPGGFLTSTGIGDWQGQSSDVVFDNNIFTSTSNAAAWTNADWLNNPYSYLIRANAPCTSITANHFTNSSNAIAMTAEKGLAQGNLIENFSNDAIDVTSSNLLVKANTIKNGLNTTADPVHPDGIQGWSTTSNGVTTVNNNVVIDGNTILKTGDTSVTYMQGISIYDGRWDSLVVQNNVVSVNTWNAIALYGTQRTKVLNNTVVSSDPISHPSWIQIHDGKDGTVSSGATVRNNIATQLDIAKGDTVFDHNIAAALITTYPGGTKTFTKLGTIGTSNTVLPAVLNGFMTLNTAAGTFDLRLRPTSVAVGFGTATGAPALDILGKARTAPVDAGAYVH